MQMDSTYKTILATVDNVYSDGVSLIFDGQQQSGGKHYKCNTSISFKKGDRVKVCKDSGTFIVEYVVGPPGSGGGGSSSGGVSSVNGYTGAVRLGLSDIPGDVNHRTVSDTQITKWNSAILNGSWTELFNGKIPVTSTVNDVRQTLYNNKQYAEYCLIINAVTDSFVEQYAQVYLNQHKFRGDFLLQNGWTSFNLAAFALQESYPPEMFGGSQSKKYIVIPSYNMGADSIGFYEPVRFDHMEDSVYSNAGELYLYFHNGFQGTIDAKIYGR